MGSFKMLMILLSNLDVRLFLMSKYNIESNISILLENCRHEDGFIICDEQSMTLQYILESLKCVGGPTERKVLQLQNETMFQKEIEDASFEQKIHEPSEILSLLKAESDKTKDWKIKVTQLYEHYTRGNGTLSWQIIAELLSKLCSPYEVKSAETEVFIEKKLEIATKMFQALASKQGLDIPSRIFCQILEHEQSKRWLLLVLTLMYKGNFSRALAISKCFETRHNMTKIGHCVEFILKEEFPMILSKLKSTNISAAFIACQWLNQYFLNTFDFMQVINFVLIESLYSSDYAIYTCISIFRHLERQILSSNGEDDLILVLICDPISKFSFGDYLEYMHNLSRNYSQYILSQ